ncbi:PREDICTED: larval cuticle protein A3A [Rhagoletis zephyria]|uniref:larval cuticle protein A3A n=1 Tax=Rhagoletis zephyria TaxID=28612 RepID=UPI00081159FA|nr:PREDICTED: larval cuticle protein A3A [Rhagoletis zephyria]XP_036333868.1 larval cuticle protein A3A [Rhagoletis pomonella]
MLKFILIACLLVQFVVAAPLDQTAAEEKAELERIQNESAQYSYGSNVQDNINDGAIQREETRDGTKVKGMYSYRDGYVMRTVHYEADENGYRVVKEETQEIGDGPQFDENGEATVEGSLIPTYSIRLDKSDNERHYKDARLN